MTTTKFSFYVKMMDDTNWGECEPDEHFAEECCSDFVEEQKDRILEWYREQMPSVAEAMGSEFVSISHVSGLKYVVEVKTDDSTFEDMDEPEINDHIETLIQMLIDPDDDRNYDLHIDDGVYYLCSYDYYIENTHLYLVNKDDILKYFRDFAEKYPSLEMRENYRDFNLRVRFNGSIFCGYITDYGAEEYVASLFDNINNESTNEAPEDVLSKVVYPEGRFAYGTAYDTALTHGNRGFDLETRDFCKYSYKDGVFKTHHFVLREQKKFIDSLYEAVKR